MTTSLPILMFHALDDQPSAISFPPGLFRRGMAKLREHGYRTLNLLEVVSCLRQGTPFPARSFIITFDDGYQSVYREAFPILQQYGFSAIIFLTVGEKTTVESSARLPSMEGRSMLSWGEIRELHRAGLSFGAHTLTHPDLTRVSADRIEIEARHSKAIIEDALGEEVTCFAYPFGRHDQRSRQIVRQYYACACSTRLRLVTAQSDPYALERVGTYYLRSDKLFEVMLSRLFPWYLWARRIPRALRQALLRGLE